MINFIKELFKKTKCNNFDCTYEWDGVCRFDKPDLRVYTRTFQEAGDHLLLCRSFKQVEGG